MQWIQLQARRFESDRPWRLALESFLIAGFIVLALVPTWNIWSIIVTTGANNTSNDYVAYSGMIDRMLGGVYDWQSYFRDTMIGFHSLAIPFLVRLAIIELTHWNIYWELYVGLTAAAIRVVLLFDALTQLIRRPIRWLLLPVLAALAYSTSQISVFGYGDASLSIQLTQLGLAAGVWGLVRFRGRWAGVALAVLGGALATLSGGGGLPVWPVYFAGMVLLGYRRWRFYAVLAVGALVSVLPYLLYSQSGAATPAGTGHFDWPFIVAAVGWPFSEGFSTSSATTVGYLGIAIGLCGLVFMVLRGGSKILRPAAPALMLLVYGVLNTWAISYARGVGLTGLAPWYTTHFLPIWIGLVGLAYVLWAYPGPSAIDLRRLGRWTLELATGKLWPLAFLSILGVLYFNSNLTSADKAMYLYSRAPASASCLRNYRNAPTVCESYLFQWGVGNPVLMSILAEPLAKYHLGVFSPDQEWALQGDYTLSSVQLHQSPGTPATRWTPSELADSWTDYQHLNLELYPPTSLYWTVTLPRNVTQADLHSAVAVDASAGGEASRGVAFKVGIAVAGGPERAAFSQTSSPGDGSWHGFSIPLSAYAGKVVTIHLAADAGSAGAVGALFQYPVIDLHLAGGTPAGISAWSGPAPSSRDVRLDGNAMGSWTTSDMQRVSGSQGGGGTWTAGAQPSLTYHGSLSACIANYSDLSLGITLPTIAPPATLNIFYETRGPAGSRAGFLVIPLYADGLPHTYSYSLKLLQLPAGTRLTGLALTPRYMAPPGEPNTIQITSVRLIHAPWTGTCG